MKSIQQDGDSAEMFTVPAFCGVCHMQETHEVLHVELGLVEWTFQTCMTCGTTKREVAEFDNRLSLVSNCSLWKHTTGSHK